MKIHNQFSGACGLVDKLSDLILRLKVDEDEGVAKTTCRSLGRFPWRGNASTES